MSTNKQALRQTAEKAQEHGVFNMDIHSEIVLALLDELEAADRLIDTLRQDKDKVIDMSIERVNKLLSRAEAAEKRIAELEGREVKMPELKMLSDYLREVTLREREDIILGVKLEFHRNLKAAGISVKGE